MYDGIVEDRMREQEYWNSLIYRKWKGENWDRDVKMRLEFKFKSFLQLSQDLKVNLFGLQQDM